MFLSARIKRNCHNTIYVSGAWYVHVFYYSIIHSSNKYYKYRPFLKNLSVLQKQKLKFWIREISDKINCKCSMKNQTLKMQRRQLKMQSPIFIYLKRTNFRVYVFSQISRSLVDFAKLKQAKFSFKRHSRK